MRQHAYKLAGSNIPAELVGKTLNVRVAESAADAKSLCKDGDEARIIALFNQQHILNQERVGKAECESDEVKAFIVKGDVTGALAYVQAQTDAYLSGARAAGVPSEAKVALAEKKGAQAKLATLSPKDRERAEALLKSLGMSV